MALSAQLSLRLPPFTALATVTLPVLAGALPLPTALSQPICTPTRSALMTGRYTIRLGTQSSVIYWDTPWAIPINETFIGTVPVV